MWPDRSEKVTGRGRLVGSMLRDYFRFILTATVPSSIYFTFSEEELQRGPGRGMGGLRKAPLNLMMKISPPKKAPWGVPAGMYFRDDSAPLYAIFIVLFRAAS